MIVFSSVLAQSTGAAPRAVERLWMPLLSQEHLLLFGGLAFFALLVAWTSAVGSPRYHRLLLLFLRATAFFALAVVLAGPHLVENSEREIKDPFVVLIDSSSSMGIEDGDLGSRAARVASWLEKHEDDFAELSSRYELFWFLVDDGLQPWSPQEMEDSASYRFLGDSDAFALSAGPRSKGAEPRQTPSNGFSTDLGLGLLSLREALNGAVPAGVLLISDGADQGAIRQIVEGEVGDLEALLGPIAAPISTWAVGEAKGPPDQGVLSFSGPPFGFVRRPLKLRVRLRSFGLPDRPLLAVLRGDGEVLQTQEVELAEGAEYEIEFEVKPDQVGFHTYRLELPNAEGDSIASNNSAEVTVKVVRDRTRVLQLTSHPSWDVKMLRRLFKTDPNVDLVCFFILRGHNGGALARRGPLSLIPFPFEELFFEDLQGFDLVVFHNFSFGSFTSHRSEPYHEALLRYVQEGGAFLAIGGDASLGEASSGWKSLSEVLPTEVLVSPYSGGRMVPRLTEVGERHPVTQLARGIGQNRAAWEGLSPLRGANPLGSPREGGQVLLRGPSDEVLAATASIGKGRSMVFASDSSWRWQLAGRELVEGEGTYPRFWRNAVRWLVRDMEERQVQLSLDRENPIYGEDLSLSVQVLSEDYAPLPNAAVEVEVSPVGSAQKLEISGSTGPTGQVSFDLNPRQSGSFDVQVQVPQIPGAYGQAEARFTLREPKSEFVDPRARPELLQAISDATGGHSLAGTDPNPVSAATRPQRRLSASFQDAQPEWASPFLLLLIVLPLGIEWTLRRRAGLR